MFAHEKLQVYSKALDFAARAASLTSAWDKRHALVDQLDRAAASVLSNLAEATRLQGSSGRLRFADYSIGSALECAGCLDVARIKRLLTAAECIDEKTRLCEVTKMLMGLRNSWAESMAREEPPAYGGETASPRVALFHHERLVVYQAALAFMEWFVARLGADAPSQRIIRRIDESGTSAVLNIAEGNGRYAELDHLRFLQIAESCAVKAAVHVDLGTKAGLWTEANGVLGKEHLRRIS
jgi:four helix bundle protein